MDTDPFLRSPCFSTRRLTSRPFPESRRCRRMRRRRGSSATPTTLLGAAEVSPHPGVTAKISSPMLHLHVSTSGEVGPGSLGSSSSSLLEDSPRLLPTAYTPSPPRLPRLRPVSRFVVERVSQKSILSSVVGLQMIFLSMQYGRTQSAPLPLAHPGLLAPPEVSSLCSAAQLKNKGTNG